MQTVWVIDTKVSIAPKCSFETDGSDHYYGRSFVPASTREQAIESLRNVLKENPVEILEVTGVAISTSREWDSELDEFFDTAYNVETAAATSKLQIGIFASGIELI